MKKSLLVLALAAAVAPVLAQAEAGDWVVRARVVSVNPDESSDLGKKVNGIPGYAGAIPPNAELSVDNNIIPELDISYYFTKNIAAELILALGSKHDVNVKGGGPAAVPSQHLGSVDLLPPTLTAQWHFLPDQTFDPYVGAGINYTYALDRNLKFSQGPLAGNKIKIDSDSWGLVGQVGIDINLANGWLLNADVKYIQMDTDVHAKLAGNAGAWYKIDSLDINPWVFGVGVGKKF